MGYKIWKPVQVQKLCWSLVNNFLPNISICTSSPFLGRIGQHLERSPAAILLTTVFRRKHETPSLWTHKGQWGALSRTISSDKSCGCPAEDAQHLVETLQSLSQLQSISLFCCLLCQYWLSVLPSSETSCGISNETDHKYQTCSLTFNGR